MVSIIILTYNSANYINKLLESIVKFNKSSNYEIIVVDNNSEDETVKRVLSSKYKVLSIKLVQNSENFGFSKGINIGAKVAGGEYLLFINPDCEWSKGTTREFVSIFEQDVKVGVVGGKILAKNGVAEKSAGKFLKTLEVLLTALCLDEAFGVRLSPNKRCEVDFVSGGFMVVRKSLFEKFNGFDENLFLYVEDMEFCFRVKKSGLKVLFNPGVSAIHESHASSNRSFAIENIYKGLLYFHKKHGSGFSYKSVRNLLWAKAFALVLLGKIINNKDLTATYSRAFKVLNM